MLALIAAALAPLAAPALRINPDDYPIEALRNDQEGTAVATLTVDGDGRPTRCAITVSSKSQALDDATCRILLERARFAAATVPNDQHRTVRQSLAWKLSASSMTSRSLTGVIATVPIDGSGKIERCKEEVFGDSRIGKSTICDLLSSEKALEFFAGRPITPSSSGYVRMYYSPEDAEQITVSGHAVGIVPRVVLDATFQVLPSGFVKDCKVTYIDPMLPAEMFCGVFSSKHPDFDPDPSRTQPQAMHLVLDAWIAPDGHKQRD